MSAFSDKKGILVPLTQLNNRETVHIEAPSSKEVAYACVAKNTIINTTLLYGDELDPYDDITFPVTINGVEYGATIVTTLDTLTSIDFILADASSPYDNEHATYVFTLKRDDAGEWEIGDKIILVHDTETVEDFYGLLRSEQLRLLGY